MSDPFIGQIMIVGFNFAPRGWALCDGQLLQISQNTALFSLLGTTYGGDGRTTFGLPDLRGRAPIHMGSGPGLSPRSLGSRGGAEDHVLDLSEIPAHDHVIFGAQGTGSTARGVSTQLTDNRRDLEDRMSMEGGGLAHNNMQPFLTLNYVIALVGIFPSRN